MTDQIIPQLRAELQNRWRLCPTDQWLREFITKYRNPSHPLPALASTANFRLLASDFTTSLSTQTGQSFPRDSGDINTKELIISTDIPVQILDIVDTGTSRWAQIEGIERVERGEEIRGREVIRNVPGANDENDPNQNPRDNNQTPSKKGSTGPQKVLLQDTSGGKIWAFELSRIDRITIINPDPPARDASGTMTPSRVEGMQIGCKMVIRRGTKIRRGLIMLTADNTIVLGGKVELWDSKWRETRKQRLQSQLDAENSPRDGT